MKQRSIKYRYWNTITNIMVNNPKMPYKEGWTIAQLFSDRGWIWMQFTGLLDKNGKEIYEGDVVKCTSKPEYKGTPDDNAIGKIKQWKDGQWQVAYKNENSGLPINWGGYISLEVIGNIYSNPELIK